MSKQDGVEIAAARPNRAPTHPGVMLRDIVLPGLALSVTDAAKHLKVTRQQLHRILAQESGISPEMALRLGKLCGNGPDLWVRMQEAYDLWEARRRIGRTIDSIPTLKTA